MNPSRESTRRHSTALPSGSTSRIRCGWLAGRCPETSRLLTVATAVSLVLTALLVSACGSGGSPGAGDETQQLRKKYVELRRAEEALTAEYPLAKESAPYLVVDIPNRSLELKARGRSLRRFGILEARILSGGDGPTSVWSMTDRRPLAEVERPKIAPGAGEQAVAEAAKNAVWGPFRMPADFDLVCEGGDVLQIRALPAETSHSAIIRWITSAQRRSADWFRRWRASGKEKPRYSIQLWLPENDSQLLFWSLPKKLSILILRGSRAESASIPADPHVLPQVIGR